jgi:hypothetical protein
MKKKQYLWLGGSLMFAASALQAADVNVTADITTNTTWTAANAYILDKSIFVKNGATLTIEPGTTILGTKNVANNTYGSLIISRDGTIMAEGTAEAPIVMTAKEDRDAELTPDPLDDLDPATDGGLYGGLIILGSAPINYYTGPTTNANEFSIEGFPAGSSTDILYGGNDVTDNSGVVKYMSLRFGGYVYDAVNGKEINGLTMGGVGSGTTIENVEIVGNTDDGMEIFGGTVNTKRIAVAFCQDDSFDLDEGHQGFHQFWFAIQNSNGTLGDRGGEWDGGNGSDPVRTGTPHTTAIIHNATFIGDSATSGGGNTGIYLDDYFAGQLHNSVLHQFSGAAIAKASDGVGNGVSPQPSAAVFSNNTWGTFAGGAGLVIGAAGSPTGTGNSAVETDPMLEGISRTANGRLDPRPNLASPLRNSTLSAAPAGAPAGFFETTTYRGAFGDTNWLDGWSYLSRFGYLSIPKIKDVTPPVITLIVGNPINLTVGDSFTDPGAKVTDDVDSLTTVLGTGTVNTAVAGTYVLTYNASDVAGNAATAMTRNVIVSEVEVEFPTSAEFRTSAGSPLDISNYFQDSQFKDAKIALVGKLPIGIKFNSSTNAITGYPTVDGTAIFSVKFKGDETVNFVMKFIFEPVPLAFQGTHVLHTDNGDVITAIISAKGTKFTTGVSVLKQGAQKAVMLKGALMKYNAEEKDPNQQWTIKVPESGLAIKFPTLRSFKAVDNSYLGNYGNFAGNTLWGFKATTGLGKIVLSKNSIKVTIMGVVSSKGVAWSVTPDGGKSIKAAGSISADGIASISSTVLGPGDLNGMLRVQEELDINDVPTGKLNVSLLQGFEGWTPVSYTP